MPWTVPWKRRYDTPLLMRSTLPMRVAFVTSSRFASQFESLNGDNSTPSPVYGSTCFGSSSCDTTHNPQNPAYLVQAVNHPDADKFWLISTACVPGGVGLDPGTGLATCSAGSRSAAQVRALIKQGPPTTTTTTTTTAVTTTTTTVRPGMPWGIFGASTTCSASAPCVNIHPGNTDSYNSQKAGCSVPCLQSATNVGNNGSIGTNGNIDVQGAIHGNVVGSTDVAGDTSDVSLNGSGHVYGYVKSGGTISVSGTVDGGTFPNQASPQTVPSPLSNCGPPYTTLTAGNATVTGATLAQVYNQSTGTLTLNGGKKLTLTGGTPGAPATYCFKTVTVQNNNTQLNVNGATAIYADGIVQIKSGAVMNNSTQDPENLELISTYGNDAGETGTGVLLDAGGTTMYMVVYAPATKVLYQGGGNLYGAIVGKTVEITGGSSCPSAPCPNGVHYDEYLGSGNAHLLAGLDIPVTTTVVTTTTTTYTYTVPGPPNTYHLVNWRQC